MRRSLSLLLALAITASTTAQTINYDPPPAAQGQISPSDYKTIVDTSLSIIATHYKISSVNRGSIKLTKGFNNDEAGGTLNLDNLVLKCIAEKNKGNWPAIIHGHFESLFESITLQKKIDVSNFESIKKYLSIRIYPEETVAARGGIGKVIARQDLEGTYTLLMLDLPGAFTSVTKSMFDTWKKDTAEAFRAAQANIDQQKVEKLTKTFPFDKGEIEINFLGDENYAASYALDLEHNAPEFLGEWGCAVSIPNKGLVNVCKISPDHPVDFVKFIQFSKEAIEKAYEQHSQPISRDYFWYYKGKFTRITVVADDQGKIQVVAPYGLATLMTKKD